MRWRQALLYILCVMGIYCFLFGIYLFSVEEILYFFLSSSAWLLFFRFLFLLVVGPFCTYGIVSLLPFAPEGLINPRFTDTPSIIKKEYPREE